jgi:hypothetical protein
MRRFERVQVRHHWIDGYHITYVKRLSPRRIRVGVHEWFTDTTEVEFIEDGQVVDRQQAPIYFDLVGHATAIRTASGKVVLRWPRPSR